jgi:hypothetical protein
VVEKIMKLEPSLEKAKAEEVEAARTVEWDSRIQIGMMVEITGYLLKGRTYGNYSTTRIRWTLPAQQRVKGMVLGKSYRYAGKLEGGWNEYDPAWLRVDTSYPVWMVQPLGTGQRYRKPLAVLQDQIVLE